MKLLDALKFVPAALCLLIFTSCSSLEKLSMQVQRSTQTALFESRLPSARMIQGDLRLQRSSRDLYLAEVDKLKQTYLSDSIVMIEYYAGGCLSCPAERIEIFYSQGVKCYTRSLMDERYHKVALAAPQLVSLGMSDVPNSSELKITYPSYYEAKSLSIMSCEKKGHQIYTLFLPGGAVQSIYTNCMEPHISY